MLTKDLEAPATRVETADNAERDLAVDVAQVWHTSFPRLAPATPISGESATSMDVLVAQRIASLPGWHFSIHGWARTDAGACHCSLRRSVVRDDDETIGLDEVSALSLAIAAAELCFAARQ